MSKPPPRVGSWLASLALLLALLPLRAAAGASRILVTVHAGAATADYRDFRRPPSYAGGARVALLLDALARQHRLQRVEGWPIRSLEVYCEVFEAPPDVILESVLAQLRADPRVDAAQPMLRHATRGGAPGDPLRSTQPVFAAWRLDAVHRVARGEGATIAVVDAGIERIHPDLADRVATRTDFTGGRDAGAHGTAVAGLIAAQPDNGVGLVGVAPRARVLDLKACWTETARPLESICDSLSLARALDAAIAAHAGVVNLSLSGPDDPLVGRLIARATAGGTSVIAAAGPPRAPFPASRDDVIAVSGEHRRDVVQAPAAGLWTTFPRGRYDVVEGDSFAAAQVAGLVALIRQRHPDWSPRRVRALLLAQTPLEPLALLSGRAAQRQAAVDASLPSLASRLAKTRSRVSATPGPARP